MKNSLSFERINSFDMTANYVESESVLPENAIGHHIHSQCEIYVHLGGDVSFMVEDQLYPIQYGNIIITRPYEYHHCIYHAKTKHSHFCITFSGDNNERLLKSFFDRQAGRNNLFCLNTENTEKFIGLCHSLCRHESDEIENFHSFFGILRLLDGAVKVSNDTLGQQNEIAAILHKINSNYAEPPSIAELANDAHVSVSTLERWFGKHIGMSPSAYIKKIRLSNAMRLLDEGNSVTDVSTMIGFSDTSNMIALFKSQYGMTPLQYKKRRGL